MKLPEYLMFEDKLIKHTNNLSSNDFINEEYTQLLINREFAKINTYTGTKRLYGEYSNIEHFGYPFYVEWFIIGKSEKFHKKGFMTIEEAIDFYNTIDI